jgi:hypothetical protein
LSAELHEAWLPLLAGDYCCQSFRGGNLRSSRSRVKPDRSTKRRYPLLAGPPPLSTYAHGRMIQDQKANEVCLIQIAVLLFNGAPLRPSTHPATLASRLCNLGVCTRLCMAYNRAQPASTRTLIQGQYGQNDRVTGPLVSVTSTFA